MTEIVNVSNTIIVAIKTREIFTTKTKNKIFIENRWLVGFHYLNFEWWN